ncbi:MAG: hypothetical protein OER43_04570 [Gammaproteobacteria bacterium]|nr:hypothetical protein [Gammaproteobacteria bacterium]
MTGTLPISGEDSVWIPKRFTPLAAGEVITTGTLTAALPIRPGETWSSEYSGLPVAGLQLTFTD